MPISRAVSALLVFLNAHLAFHTTNRISVIAGHCDRAEFLYPAPQSPATQPQSTVNGSSATANGHGGDGHEDTPMLDASATASRTSTYEPANFYRPFANLAASLTPSIIRLMDSTDPASLELPPSVKLASALTLALTHTSRVSREMAPPAAADGDAADAGRLAPGLVARILVLSTTPASAGEYIPLMNAIFAAQRLRVPIDVLTIDAAGGDRDAPAANGSSAAGPELASPFLQQAAATTGGTYLALQHPHGLLQTLLQAFLPSPPARACLVPPVRPGVDFRAACFCHRRVVDVGYVCSVCLSIFCEPPTDATCLTCGHQLALGSYGRAPMVVKRRKRRRREDGGTPGGATPGRGTPTR